jgi:hypothetical protein
MPFSIWTLLALLVALPGSVWGCIQIYDYYCGPQPKIPNTLDAVLPPDQPTDEERALVKFDMARALWPGTLEFKISTILQDVPSNDQLPLLLAPEYVSKWAQKRYDLWTGLAGLILSLSITPSFVLGMSIWRDGISTRGIVILSAFVIVFLSIPFAMFRRAFRARRLSRRADRFAELCEESGLRLAFEWTAIKSRYEKPQAPRG